MLSADGLRPGSSAFVQLIFTTHPPRQLFRLNTYKNGVSDPVELRACGVDLEHAKRGALSPFHEVHRKIQEARERGRKERERDEALRKEKSEKEAKREGFDRA